MGLAAFSASLAVKDMAAAKGFYARLGFEMVGCDGETWTIIAITTMSAPTISISTPASA